uniref:Uncharacterized protein n=1 Tax=Vespula pensylvanica TaxID=30213 RepID=A0A834UD92_VESPE|nr:hypothetical protein H0235_004837 [Vespula pensylvanica]
MSGYNHGRIERTFGHVEDEKVFRESVTWQVPVFLGAVVARAVVDADADADASGTVRSDQAGMRNGLLMGEIGVEVGYHGYTGNDALPG